MKNPWVAVGVVVVLLIIGSVFLSNQSAQESNESITITDHVKGNPEASVMLTEYSDFQCPACSSFQPVVESVLEQYGDQIRFEYRHFPLITIHPHALRAAIAAEAAGQQGKFFEFHDLLFQNQQEWSTVAVPTTFFVKYAEELELDIEQFRSQLNSSLLEERVRSQFDEARELGLTGTPSFLLNGQKMKYETLDEFLGQIAAAIDPSSASGTAAVGSDVRFGF
ncbi:MAG: thioredoxin domain-containing protein [Candidatus Kaiserbacteria bacterium]|nr:thioredoxin domain-containing protein [Candidatus Kaiserbacteria bacterium]MCB9815866.1 thioredoxin domain-containing protein [Candidatus Nomurabacteria bacterium]